MFSLKRCMIPLCVHRLQSTSQGIKMLLSSYEKGFYLETCHFFDELYLPYVPTSVDLSVKSYPSLYNHSRIFGYK